VTKPRNIIITASNDLYLPLALDMLRSLSSLSFSSPFDIGVIDVGLGDNAKTQLEMFGAVIVPARVDIEYPDRLAWEQQAPAFRSLTVRPYLRDYFPGYQAYMWFDADAWAQTPDAVNVMLAGAASGPEMYIAAEIDRDYQPYFLSSQPWIFQHKWLATNFPPEIVNAIFPRPMLNAGIWAIGAQSPVWQAWGEVYTTCLQRFEKMTREQFMCDQLSLNVAMYMQGLPMKVMPAEFNWLTLYAEPMWDAERNLLVRPTMPRTPISILHLTHEKKLRSFNLATTAGGTHTRTLMYSAT